MSITIRTIHKKPLQLPADSQKLPKDLSDRELNAKLCRDVAGGCKKCESLEFCQFGKEHFRREENRE